MPNHYAVMGDPISHSLSPEIHQLFAKQTGCILTYEKIQIDPLTFEQQVNDFFNTGGKGLNITLPCKQRAFAMSEVVTDRCLQAKSANILWQHMGKLYADNTDGIGLLRDLSRYIDLTDKRILLLGAGGAVRGVLGPLLSTNPAKLTVANRTVAKADELQRDFSQMVVCDLNDLHDEFDVVINGTSASLSCSALALPMTVFASKPLCYDLAYQKQGQTSFVKWAQSLGCVAVDGFGMLVEQAAEAFYIWHEVMPDTSAILKMRKDMLQHINDVQ